MKVGLTIAIILTFFSVIVQGQNVSSTILTSPIEIYNVLYIGCASGVENPPSGSELFEEQVYNLVSTEWSTRGLASYSRLSKLDHAARYHATDMAADTYFDHNSYDRIGANLVKVCNWDVRVKNFYVDNWLSVAENIAAGQTTPEEVMTSWMNSPLHRDNILSPNLNQMGQVDLININGRVVHSVYKGLFHTGLSYKFSIDASALPTGIYFICVKSHRQCITKKYYM